MSDLGSLGGIFRYPVKSMSGERIVQSIIDENGVFGDRIYALQDLKTGKLASAKQPKAWGDLLKFEARIVDERSEIVQVTGITDEPVKVPSQAAADTLGNRLGREISICRTAAKDAELDRADPLNWLEVGPEGPAKTETHQVARAAAPGSFFDFAPIHIVTTASLTRVRALHPLGQSDALRYRPNIIIRSPDLSTGFVENEWRGCVIRIGRDLTLEVITPTPRCVIPTLEHAGAPTDADALRVIVKENMLRIPNLGVRPCFGVYAKIRTPGRVIEGDQVVLL